MKAKLDSFTSLQFSEAEGELGHHDAIRVPFIIKQQDSRQLHISLPADEGKWGADVFLELEDRKVIIYYWDDVENMLIEHVILKDMDLTPARDRAWKEE